MGKNLYRRCRARTIICPKSDKLLSEICPILSVSDIGQGQHSCKDVVRKCPKLSEPRKLKGILKIRFYPSVNLNAKAMADRLGGRLASRLFPRNPDLKDVRLVTVAAPDYRGKTD